MVGETVDDTQFATEKAARRSAFRLLHGVRLLSLLPADGLEGGTLKLEKCGFGPSSHSAPSFSVSSGGDVIKTPGHQGLEIRGTARHAGWLRCLGGALDNG